MKKNTFLALFLGAFAWVSCGKKEVETQPIRKDIIESVFASGTLEADQSYFLVAQVEGYLTDVRLEEGQELEAGEVVAVIDNAVNRIAEANANDQLVIAQQNAASSAPQLKQLVATIAATKQKKQQDSLQTARLRRLAASQSIAKVEAENAELVLETTEKTLESLEQQYKTLQVQANQQLIIQRNQAQINAVVRDYNQVKALVKGNVLQKFKEKGDYVRKGDILAKIGNKQLIFARLSVDETSIARVKIGQEVTLQLNTQKGKLLTGKVSEILPTFDEASQSFVVHVQFQEKLDFAIVGTQLEANIFIETRKNVLVIPRSYLGYGNTVRRKGEKESLAIVPGFISDEWVEIKEGLTEKDVIVIENTK